MNSSSSNSPAGPSLVLIDLLACFVATNGVGLEKGYELAKTMEEDAIVAIDTESHLIKCEEQLIFSWLHSSSYPRGEYVARLVANRIKRSTEQINSQGGATFLESLKLLSESDARAALTPLFGVGEKFINGYLIIAPRH
jgi:hypothetical protein